MLIGHRPTVALVDVDILIFHYGTAIYDMDFGDTSVVRGDIDIPAALQAVEDKIDYLCEDHGLTNWVFSMGVGTSFRKLLASSYKAHRKSPPEAITELRRTFMKKHKAREIQLPYPVENLEADDVLGLAQDQVGYTTVIISADKDMLQIPGYNLHPFKGVMRFITEEEANDFTLYQTLVGDSADGYSGCVGIGDKRATGILSTAKAVGLDFQQLWDVVHFVFLSQGMSTEDFKLQAQMATILRDPMPRPPSLELPEKYKTVLEEIENAGEIIRRLPSSTTPT